MSAERLREAASLMRQDAAIDPIEFRRGIAKMGPRTPKGRYAAAWHPLVALAVADLLDVCAKAQETSPSAPPTTKEQAAFKVANAYLGDPA